MTDKAWFDLHLSPDEARKLNRVQYRKARHWLRYVRRIISERHKMAHVHPNMPDVVVIPAFSGKFT